MVIAILSHAAGAVWAVVTACAVWLRRFHERRAIRQLLLLDDHMLRDIGLSRSDVVGCLSSPHEDAAEFFAQRRKSRSVKVPPAEADSYKIAA